MHDDFLILLAMAFAASSGLYLADRSALLPHPKFVAQVVITLVGLLGLYVLLHRFG